MNQITATEYKHMTVQDLIRAIQKFAGDNERSNSVENRWLCTVLANALDAACEVGNGRLSEENRKDVNAFRAVEIEGELERKRRDIAALERDLLKARA